MAYKALIFSTDEAYEKMKPFYETAVNRGDFEIVARGKMEGDNVSIVYTDDKLGCVDNLADFDLMIISSGNRDFYERMKQLENLGVPRDKMIDGRVFGVSDLDFPRFMNERIAYGSFTGSTFREATFCIYPRIFSNAKVTIKVGAKSYFGRISVARKGELSIGKYCAIASGNTIHFAQTLDHNYQLVTSYALSVIDWESPKNYYKPAGITKVIIGNDVWIGQNCILKSLNPAKPLIIGDGAVIARDSVVVKNVPPYAIVGGNPAKIIKYRFSEDVIESLLRIKWWDWSLDKIHDNFKYFNDIEKFISLHDK